MALRLVMDADAAVVKAKKKKTKRPKRPVMSNDELLFDPDEDDDNQKWMDSQRSSRGRNPFEEFGTDAATTTASSYGDPAASSDPAAGASAAKSAAAAEHNKKRGLRPAATSDAVLNCAACMSTLCLDCQR